MGATRHPGTAMSAGPLSWGALIAAHRKFVKRYANPSPAAAEACAVVGHRTGSSAKLILAAMDPGKGYLFAELMARTGLDKPTFGSVLNTLVRKGDVLKEAGLAARRSLYYRNLV